MGPALKGRQKFVEDLVRHPGRKTLLYRHLSSFVPNSQNYGGQAGRVPFLSVPGVKPRAESYSPFGTKPKRHPACDA
jgi:hypothetical protein